MKKALCCGSLLLLALLVVFAVMPKEGSTTATARNDPATGASKEPDTTAPSEAPEVTTSAPSPPASSTIVPETTLKPAEPPRFGFGVPAQPQVPADSQVLAQPLGEATPVPPPDTTTAVPADTTSSPLENQPNPLLAKEKLICDYTAAANDLDGFLGNANAPPGDGCAVCELLLLDIPKLCQVLSGKESIMDCIKRETPARLEPLLPYKCTTSPWWQKISKEHGSLPAPSAEPLKQRDPLWRAQVQPVVADEAATDKMRFIRPSYVQPKDRTHLADKIQSRQCNAGAVTIHPIIFGVPEANIVESVSRLKLFDWMPNPQRRFPPWRFPPGPYRLGHQDEYLSNQIHRYSYFHWTHKRGGWDCARHTEILAAGAIPYFADLPNCGRFCVALLPKELLKKAFELPGVSYLGHVGHNPNHEYMGHDGGSFNYNKPGKIKHEEFDKPKYFALADELLAYTKKYLTTKSIAAYMLAKIGYENPKKMLIVGRGHLDYLEVSLEDGFASLGIPYATTYARGEYKQAVPTSIEKPITVKELERIRDAKGVTSTLHGAGMVYGLRTPPLESSTNHDDLRRMIKDKEFDLVLFSYWSVPAENYPLYNEVVAAGISPNRIIFADGNDEGGDNVAQFQQLSSKGHMFKRELHDNPC